LMDFQKILWKKVWCQHVLYRLTPKGLKVRKQALDFCTSLFDSVAYVPPETQADEKPGMPVDVKPDIPSVNKVQDAPQCPTPTQHAME